MRRSDATERKAAIDRPQLVISVSVRERSGYYAYRMYCCQSAMDECCRVPIAAACMWWSGAKSRQTVAAAPRKRQTYSSYVVSCSCQIVSMSHVLSLL